MAGDYDRFSHFMESSAVEFLNRVSIPSGASLLDVACGSGQLALVAARRGVRVTGVDIAVNSIRAARDRAQAEALPAQFDEGDAEALPYPDASFDVVASLFGAMFAPRPDLVAQELVRVCRPGGMIAMANWTKAGFIGQMFGPDQEALHADLVALWCAQNQSGDANRTAVDAEYLEVVAIRSKQ
jgi:ubiquinone/menaquinone biosynthesis C-methylase UbiE